MSHSEFRSYKKDCQAYQKLTKRPDNEIVLQLRLSMDADLKRIIDTNYPNWEGFAVDDAINTVEQIVRETCNPVVYRKQFSELSQLKDEKIHDFHTKLRACAVDCAFQCPYDPDHDLTEYHIMNRIRSAVYDEQLQHEILQKHELLNTLDTLIKYCENFETTKKDSARLKSNTDNNISNVNLGDDITDEEIVAAVSSYSRRKQQPAKSSYP